ncbi:MAG: membrane bound O-acyl transferase family-domain-containing protein, partial [Verrucomicrobia bacterium]|nr:membrane bound O-acyl transferase family-domain-containing protein [Verrucomicrobiota bacterium]
MNSGRLLSLTVLAASFGSLWLLRESAPLVRLAAASLGLLWVIKVAGTLWQQADGARFHRVTGLLCFLFAWPGISVAGFEQQRKDPPAHTGERFLESWLAFVLGTLTLIVICLWGKGENLYGNYLALVCVLFIVHLGLVEVSADLLRLGGFAPASLFNRPWQARSLREFWSQRWNLAFVQMNRIFLLRPLRGKVPTGVLTFSIFIVSGLLHELGISYPDGVSWGKPLLYFVIQGMGIELEQRRRLPRLLVLGWILLPLPLLFTPDFVNLFLGGLGHLAAAGAANMTRSQWLAAALTVGGFGHVCVLAASLQVPARLRWSEEFGRLCSLNRKVFWT